MRGAQGQPGLDGLPQAHLVTEEKRLGEVGDDAPEHLGLVREWPERLAVGPQRIEDEALTARPCGRAQEPLRGKAIPERRRTSCQLDFHRVLIRWTFEGLEGPQIVVNRLWERQTRSPGSRRSNLLEFLDLKANILGILLRVPGAFDLELFSVPSRRRRSRSRNPERRRCHHWVVEDAGLGMVERAMPPWIVWAARMIERQGYPTSSNQPPPPSQRAESMAGDVVFLRTPTGGDRGGCSRRR